jgi:hypothetical protein
MKLWHIEGMNRNDLEKLTKETLIELVLKQNFSNVGGKDLHRSRRENEMVDEVR